MQSDQIHLPGFLVRLHPLVDQQFTIDIFDVKLDCVQAEEELPADLFGFTFTVITFIFFYFSVKGDHKEGEGLLKYFFLLAVFVSIGLTDFAIKVFKSWRPEQEEPYFIFFIFSSAFVYSSLYIIAKKVKISKNTFLLGLVLGIPNVFSTIFLLGALASLPAIVVYPFINVGIIVFTTFLAFMIWKEKLNRWGF